MFGLFTKNGYLRNEIFYNQKKEKVVYIGEGPQNNRFLRKLLRQGIVLLLYNYMFEADEGVFTVIMKFTDGSIQVSAHDPQKIYDYSILNLAKDVHSKNVVSTELRRIFLPKDACDHIDAIRRSLEVDGCEIVEGLPSLNY